MQPLNIPFPEKFTQNLLDKFVIEYFYDSQKDIYKSIIFDLGKLQWISSEEITFLFAWIRKIVLLDKKIVVILPFSYKTFINDNDDIIQRRRFIKFYLWKVWSMYDLGLKDFDFRNYEDINYLIDIYNVSSIGKKVLPFQKINLDKNIENIYIDKKYRELTNSKGKSIFSIENEIIKMLDENDCYSPFENKVISDIITKELIMNSIEHSNCNECYFTATLINKWQLKNPNSSINFQNQFILEKPSDILDFYKDKEKCKNIIDSKLNNEKYNFETKIANLQKSNEYNIFKNQSYVEFTFLDFGDGIYNTLKNDYINEIELRRYVLKKSLSDGIFDKELDNQILEYAFLLESSKNPFDRKIQYYHLIPRGLYSLIDMVRRYKGLLVARSGKAKLIFDFSNEIFIDGKTKRTELRRKYTAKDAVNHSTNEFSFQGTMISIVLPERKTLDFKKSGIRIDNKELNHYIFNRENAEFFPREIFSPKEFHYLSLSFIFNVLQSNISYEKYNDKLGILNIIFEKINEKLIELKSKNCVLFIDFECLPDRNEVFRILLYLSNTPLVNEFTKVIILNLDNDEIVKLKSYEFEVFEESPNFVFKPIPCLNINLISGECPIENINWFGIKDKNDEILLTQLFFGKNENFSISNIEDKWLAEGNVFSLYQDRVYSIFENFKDLVARAIEAKKLEITKWINEHSYIIKSKLKNKLLDNPENENKKDIIFLTSKGTFQKDYLTIYDPLNFKYTARYFAEFLLNLYIQNEINNYNKLNNHKFEKLNENEKKEIYKSFRFDKILSVTVSSQLIAIEMRNIIREKNKFKFLLKNDVKDPSIEDCPNLIKLTNYFSFEDEEPFHDITKDGFKNILIVNDVISTGSLIERIKKGCENDRVNAIIKGVLCVADTRIENVDINNEYESIYFKEVEPNGLIFENKIISIISTDKSSSIKYNKYKPSAIDNISDFKIKRINPILNSIVTLKNEHTEKVRVLYDEPEELFNYEDIFENNIFKIGHFRQNLYCNSYFTNMNKLFGGVKGKDLLELIKNKIESEPSRLGISEIDVAKVNLINAIRNIEFILGRSEENVFTHELKRTVHKLKEISLSSFKEDSSLFEYHPDFIFHPIHSGIEEVTEDVYFEVFKTNKANIISLQRYETKNGWRFPFPSKILNSQTKGKHILIIDSGALSGQSLVQLIDSISFLEVGKIDVITVIGRLDDFQREFYSRLKSIKVKKLKSENDNKNEIVINLNVLFGINLHIPSSHYKEVCVFCNELKNLDNFKINELPTETQEYISKRKNEIKQCSANEEINAEYLPTIKVSNLPDLKSIFIMRDRLGKVDSYRFYEEYFEYFDTEIGDKVSNIEQLFSKENYSVLKNIELILICILHEPNLLDTIKDLMNNIYNICFELIKQIYDSNIDIENLYYNWKQYSLLRLFRIFKKDKIFENENLDKIYFRVKDDQNSLNYLSYLLYEPFILGEKNLVRDKLHSYFVNCYNTGFEQFKENQIEPLTKVIKNILSKIRPTEAGTNQLMAWQNLNNFFHTIYTESHNENLKSKINYYSVLIQNNDQSQMDLINNECESIFKIFRKELRLNVNRLLDNKFICSAYSFLSDISQDIKNIDNNLENVKTQEPNYFFISHQAILRQIRNIEIKYLLKKKELTASISKNDNTIFYDFCNNCKSNLKNILENIKKSEVYIKELEKNNNFVFKFDSIPKNVNVFGHHKVMYTLYEEIVINSIKREENFGAVLEMSLYEETEDYISIKVNQNRKWIKPEGKKAIAKSEGGGFSSTLQSFFNEGTGFGYIENITRKNKEDKEYILLIKHKILKFNYE